METTSVPSLFSHEPEREKSTPMSKTTSSNQDQNPNPSQNQRSKLTTTKPSDAQLAANRLNALKSTGPRTPFGKSISRQNGLKHGLTGEGIVLPTEDVDEVDRRFRDLEAEMDPRSELARRIVQRIALLMLRLDRAAIHEAKATGHQMRQAMAEYDEARIADIEKLYAWIAAEPATNARRLRRTPEGIDYLLWVISDLKAELAKPRGANWGWEHCEHLHHLMGLRRVDVPHTRFRVLGEAVTGDFKNLDPADGEGLGPTERKEWARLALLELIDGEIAELKAIRESFDLEALERDRDEAAYRAMFDASPAAVLARKYDAANERALYRALKEFREIQPQTPQVEPKPEVTPEPPEELGSSLPEPSGEDVETVDADPITVEASVEVPNGGQTEPLNRRARRKQLAQRRSKGR